MGKRTRAALTAVLAAVFLLCAAVTAWHLFQSWKSYSDRQEAERVAGLPSAQPTPLPMPTLSPETAPPETASPLPEPLPEEAAALEQVDLDALREVNPEVIGWICIPETDLNYPLMFSGDNSYYLNHTWSKERNAGGAIFLEQECDPELSDFNVIIYGHRMGNSTMFGSLAYYEEEEYWRDHPSVYLVTDGWVYRCDVFAAYKTGVRTSTYRLRLTEEEEKQEFIDFCTGRAAYSTGITPTTDGQVLTLSTCTGLGASPDRWVVQGCLAQEYPLTPAPAGEADKAP